MAVSMVVAWGEGEGGLTRPFLSCPAVLPVRQREEGGERERNTSILLINLICITVIQVKTHWKNVL